MSIQAGNAGAASQRTGSPVRRRARGLAFDRTGSCDAGECRRHSRSIRFPFGGRRTANQVAIRCGSSRRSIVWAAVAGVALSRTFPGHGHRRSRVAAARRVRWIQIETTLTTRKKNNPTCGGRHKATLARRSISAGGSFARYREQRGRQRTVIGADLAAVAGRMIRSSCPHFGNKLSSI